MFGRFLTGPQALELVVGQRKRRERAGSRQGPGHRQLQPGDPSHKGHPASFPFASQETLEDIDKNGDGFVDQDEYIGECNAQLSWRHWAVWLCRAPDLPLVVASSGGHGAQLTD